MKLICLPGSDPMQVLIPLQLTNLFDGAYLLIDRDTETLAQGIMAYLSDNDEPSEGPCWRDCIDLIRINHHPEYHEIRQLLSEILEKEYRQNEEVAFNFYSANNSPAKLAMYHAANEILAPLMIVNSVSHKCFLSYRDWTRQTNYREYLPWIQPHISIHHMLKMSGLKYQPVYPKGGIGFGFERKIFNDFLTAKNSGAFDEVEKNLLFTWNEENQKNEIDIVVRKKDVVGFISLKSGKNMKKAYTFKQEFQTIRTRYPEELAGKPCLRALICKTQMGRQRFDRMIYDGILALDDVRNEAQTALMLDMVSSAMDQISKTDKPLPTNFYRRYINKQYGKMKYGIR